MTIRIVRNPTIPPMTPPPIAPQSEADDGTMAEIDQETQHICGYGSLRWFFQYESH
mgnify:CR=1 FL=1